MVYIPIDKLLATLGVLIGLLFIAINIYCIIHFIETFHFFFPGKQFNIWYIKFSYYKAGFIGLMYLLGGILLFMNKKAGWYITIGISLINSLTILHSYYVSDKLINYLIFILILAINSLFLFLFKKSVKGKYGI